MRNRERGGRCGRARVALVWRAAWRLTGMWGAPAEALRAALGGEGPCTMTGAAVGGRASGAPGVRAGWLVGPRMAGGGGGAGRGTGLSVLVSPWARRLVGRRRARAG